MRVDEPISHAASAHYKIEAFYGINEFVMTFPFTTYRMSIDVPPLPVALF